MSTGEFSVAQFFDLDDTVYDYEVRYVDMELAVETFHRLTNNVAARTGLTKRVIITDGGDHTNVEWKYGLGITFPPELAGKVLVRRKDDET